MKNRIIVVLVAILLSSQGYCRGIEPIIDEDTSRPETGEAASQEVAIYGEIKSVNAVSSSMLVQCYDYDSDSEMSVEIVTDDNTRMEGASNINEIKQGDWADINYIVVDGKNTAKSVAVEKE
ncbi:MAG: hypothetical protein PHT32_03035 [Candidatus Omnitrophica bacterium]|nr:hypothetical protein [Candidatus Omnitrophota bacterium]